MGAVKRMVRRIVFGALLLPVLLAFYDSLSDLRWYFAFFECDFSIFTIWITGYGLLVPHWSIILLLILLVDRLTVN